MQPTFPVSRGSADRAVTIAEQLAQAQLVAYNARNVDAFCACYSEDVIIRSMPTGDVVVQGMTSFRLRYVERFKSAALNCVLLSRMVQGEFVIDHEEIFGLDPNAPQTPHYAIAIYRCGQTPQGPRILEAWFIR
jgi:hypothetical protein